MASDAVGLERISRIVGYKLTKGDFSNSTPNLPMRIAILSEANTANQSGLETDGTEITTAAQAGNLYGFGSPIYHIMRILRPVFGGGIGGIPTIVYANAEASGSSAKILEVTPSGVATGNGTHTLKIAGRAGLDAEFYDINIETGDTTDDITAKIYDSVNAVIGAPVIATDTTYEAVLTSKWKGATADELSVTVDTNGDDLGISYAVVSTQSGAGTPSIAAALAQFGNEWNTIVVNGYSTNTTIMSALEAFNGIPDPNNPTGRYTGTIFKPFIAVTGSTSADPSAITDARKTNVTIAIAPAPNSTGFTFEAAANMVALFGRQAQDAPHLDVAGKDYPDMPTASNIGVMSNYDDRDAIVKKGCSTVDLVAGMYKVQDFVTTYHPIGEIPPQFRYCRNLMIDFNVRYGYWLRELVNVVDHAIANDTDTVTASTVIKPKTWKQVLNSYADNLATRALISDPDFMKASLTVGISTTNPDRLETFFRYKRSSFTRIASTTAEAGFNFGN
jgi:phage tail sheath gpL-like